MVVAPALVLVWLVVPVLGGHECAKSSGEIEEEQCLLSLHSAHSKRTTAKQANTEQTQSRPNGKAGMIKWGGYGNYCLSVRDNKFTDGQGLQLWECVGSKGQIFDIEEWRQYAYGFKVSIGGLQLQGKYGSSSDESNGAALQITEYGTSWNWNGQGDFRLAFNGGGSSTSCMTVDGNKPFNGAKVQMWECSEPEPWQIKWNFVENHGHGESPGHTAKACSAEGADRYHPNHGGCCSRLQECAEPRDSSDPVFHKYPTITRCRSHCSLPSPPAPPAPTPSNPNGRAGMIKWGGWGNWCLSLIDNKFAEGQGLQLWDCVGSKGQVFVKHEQRNFAMGFTVSIGDFELSAASYDIKNGDQLQIKQYGGLWTWDTHNEFRHASRMSWGGNDPSQYCMSVDGNKPFNGAKVQMWKCTEPQAWQLKWTFVKH